MLNNSKYWLTWRRFLMDETYLLEHKKFGDYLCGYNAFKKALV